MTTPSGTERPLVSLYSGDYGEAINCISLDSNDKLMFRAAYLPTGPIELVTWTADDTAIPLNTWTQIAVTFNGSLSNSGTSSTAATVTVSTIKNIIASATISAAGSGYSVNDVLTISGGTSTTAGTVTVSSISTINSQNHFIIT